MYVEDASRTIVPGLCDYEVATTDWGDGKDRTCWIELAVQSESPPKLLLDDFAAEGFVSADLFDPPDVRCEKSGFLVGTMMLSKGGTGPGNGWTVEEFGTNLEAICRVFHRHGIEDVRLHKVSLVGSDGSSDDCVTESRERGQGEIS